MKIRFSIIYCCRDCGNQITSQTALYGQGRCYSCSAKNRMKLIDYNNDKNPNFKNATIKVICEICDKEFFRKICHIMNHIFCSQRCYNRFKSIKMSGIKNPNYKHGNGYLPYPLEFNKELKLKIRQRDNFTCQCCGLKEQNHYRGNKQINLNIHHIDYNKMNCKENNLITVCIKCNCKLNYDFIKNENLKLCIKV